jgi:arsenate reductase
MVIVYGLKNCDSCRAARRYLTERAFVHAFHDLRADGLDGATLDKWIAALGWEALLNRNSTTWRGLPEPDKAGLDAAKARALMLAHPTLVKRPVIDTGRSLTVGFDRDVRAALQAVL